MKILGFATLLSLTFVVLGALTFRLGLLPFTVSFYAYGLGLVVCLLLVFIGGALFFRRLARKQAVGKIPLWLLLNASPVVLVIYCVGWSGFQAPPIHDITTDLLDPPAFVFAPLERISGENSLVHAGASLVALQCASYPHLRPLTVRAEKAVVWAAVKSVIATKGWRILGENISQGYIEVADVTPLMGFTDDMVIRIRPVNDRQADSGQTDKSRVDKNTVNQHKIRIDVRSASRVGMGDFGVNAARIGDFLQGLKETLNKK